MTPTDTGNTFVTRVTYSRMGWLVARYLLESSPSFSGIEVKGWNNSFPQLRARGTDMEGLLRRDLPEMSGLSTTKYMIEITSSLPEQAVLNRLQISEQPEPSCGRSAKIVPTLHTTLTVFNGGFGVISELSGCQFFRHDLKLEQIADEDQLREAFWKEINSTLPDPFYAGAEPQAKPLTTLRGTPDEMRETLEALGAALSTKTIEKYNPLKSRHDYILIAARSKRSQPSIDYRGYAAVEELRRALLIITRHYHPIGTRTEVKTLNYGHAGHDYSNFKIEPVHIDFTVPECPPARVRMTALGRIRRWFTENAPGELSLVERLCGESAPSDEPEPSSLATAFFQHQPANSQAGAALQV